MFALQSARNTSSNADPASSSSCVPNILPCRIHHDGPVETLERYWTTVSDEDGNAQTAYFRGRKLRGRRVAVPEGYQGIVAMPTDRVLPSKTNEMTTGQTEETGSEPEEPVKVLEKQTTFDEFLVWDHEAVPPADDPFVKGVEEWLKFAEAMHSSTPASTEGGEKGPST